MTLQSRVKLIDYEISAAKHVGEGGQHQSRSVLSSLSIHSSTVQYRNPKITDSVYVLVIVTFPTTGYHLHYSTTTQGDRLRALSLIPTQE